MTDNKEKKKSTYNYKAQKKYNEKSTHIGLKFIEKEYDLYSQIITACNNLGCSKQSFIKLAIVEKLERDGLI